MIYIGNHLSSSKGFLAMGKEATKLGATTFAFFTRNPRGGAAKSIIPEDARALMDYLDANEFGTLVAHAPYTMNLCSAKEDIREFAFNTLKDDFERMEYTPNQYYNFHPGSHTGQGVEIAVAQIADALNRAMFDGMTTTVLLETMAGKGTEVGACFGEIKAIIDELTRLDSEKGAKLGVCLDTCHVWDGGYDVAGDFGKVLDEFDSIVRLDRLKAIHINDSLNPLGAHKDRHARIGEGHIGNAAMEAIVNEPRVQGMPFILETPNDDAGYAKEIAQIKDWNGQA